MKCSSLSTFTVASSSSSRKSTAAGKPCSLALREKDLLQALMAKKRAAASSAAHPTVDATSAAQENPGRWERSTVKNHDLAELRRLGLLSEDVDRARLAGSEVIPKPGAGWNVTFIPFIFRGLSFPLHAFLRNLLFVYGVQLHQLTPNSLLHLSVFFTLCECFLGIHPHWGLFKHVFQVKKQPGGFDAGGFGISVRPGVEYFSLSMVDSAQGWRKRWFYIRDQTAQGESLGMDPFTVGQEIRPKRTWRNELSKPETVEVKKLVEKIQALKAGPGAPLTGIQIMTTFVRRRIQPLQHRAHGMWEYSGSEDPTRVSTEDYSPTEVERRVRSLTKLTSANPFPGPPSTAPFEAENPIPEVSA